MADSTLTIVDLGKKVKAKYPGAYDDMPDAELGRTVKGKYPGSYDDFADIAVPTGKHSVDYNSLAKKYGAISSIAPPKAESIPGLEQLGGVPPGPAPLPDVVKPITAGHQIRSEWAKQPGGVEAVESRLAESNKRLGSSQVAGFPGTPTAGEVATLAIPVAAEAAGGAAV
ncbi:MAG: hypothetical protein ABFD86_11420, partial [Bryobacteraceae bacterium]